MQVFEHHQGRAPRGDRAEPPQDRLEGVGALPLRRPRREGVSPLGGDREQGGEQREGVVALDPGEVLPQPREQGVVVGAARRAEPPSQQRDHGLQRRALAARLARRGEHRGPVARGGLAERLDLSRLSDPGLAGEQRHGAAAAARLRPLRQQRRGRLVAAHHGRALRADDGRAEVHVELREGLVERHGVRDALERVGAERAALEVRVHQPPR